MATGTQTNSGGLSEEMALFVTNLGGPSPTSYGIAELWRSINQSVQTFTPPSGYDIAIGPSGNTGATLDRAAACGSVTIAVASGTLYLNALYLPANTVINNFNFVTGTTGSTGVSHNWAGLYSVARLLLAISADNTSSDLTASTVQTYAVATTAGGAATSYTTTVGGLFYLGFMIATATTQPTMIGATAAGTTVNNIAPKYAGTSNTALTTPQAFPTTATAITTSASTLYGYTT